VALIKCPECGHDVSNKGVACAHCAFPLAGVPHGRRPAYVLEKTGRTWKQVLVLGWLLVTAGGFFLFQDMGLERSGWVGLGSWMWLTGAACIWVGRAGRWWYHG
jgi:hypothetical protein